MAPFIIFALGFAFFYYLHYHLAHRTYTNLQGQISTELDMGYVRMEGYFGHSFRNKVSEWLAAAPPPAPGETFRAIPRGRETVYVSPGGAYPASRRESGVLIIEGDFVSGTDCIFERELLVKLDCEIGARSRLQAIAVDGHLTLASGVQVRRWVDAVGSIVLEDNVTVASKVTSRAAVYIGPGARAEAYFAPRIETEGRDERHPYQNGGADFAIEIPHDPNQKISVPGYDPKLLVDMGGGTYRYDGDLKTSSAIYVSKPLVVQGDFACGQESLIAADLKAKGDIRLGAGSISSANLVAGGEIRLEQDCVFQALLHSGKKMILERGVRGLREGLPVAAYAVGPMQIQSNVVVHGKLASSEYVEAVSAPAAWLDRQKPLEETNV